MSRHMTKYLFSSNSRVSTIKIGTLWLSLWRNQLRISKVQNSLIKELELSRSIVDSEDAHKCETDIVPVAGVLYFLLESLGETTNSAPWHPSVFPLTRKVPAAHYIAKIIYDIKRRYVIWHAPTFQLLKYPKIWIALLKFHLNWVLNYKVMAQTDKSLA